MKTKRILVLLISLLMVLTMGVNTFAAEEKGKITINNVLIGNTYTIYKIFDLDGYTAGATAADASYSYTINESSPFYNCVNTMTIKSGGKDVSVFTLTAKPGAAGVYYVSLNAELGQVTENDETTPRKIADKLLAYIKDNPDTAKFTQKIDKLATEEEKIEPAGAVTVATVSGDDTKRNITFNGLKLGYYLIDTSAGTMLGLTTTKPDATINAKNQLPTITKEVKKHGDGKWSDQNSKQIGETVTFRTTVKVEAGAKNYTVYDNMGNGLKFKRISKIYYANTNQSDGHTIYDVTVDPVINNIAGNVTITTKDVTYKNVSMDFMLEFTESFTDTVYGYAETAGKDHSIYVEYEAVVTEDAEIGFTGNLNETWLTYGDNNVEVSKDETKTYVFAFDVVKTDANKKVLQGAEFELYTDSECTDLVPLVKVSDGVYRVASEDERKEAGFKSAVIVAGNVTIKGVGASFVDSGRAYYLKETKAPEGYNKLAAAQQIRIEGSEEQVLEATVTDGVWQSGGLRIENNKGSLLPETGGIGTTVFYVVGGVLLVGAVVLLVTKKRMSADSDK